LIPTRLAGVAIGSLPLWSAALGCRLSAALALPAAGERQNQNPSLFCDGRLWFVDCGGSHRASRNRGPTVDRTRWFDQRVGAEVKCVVLANDRTALRSKIVASDNPKW